MDDEFLDYWDLETEESEDDFWISIYTLPIAAIVIISIVLVVLFSLLARDISNTDSVRGSEQNITEIEPAPAHRSPEQTSIADFFSPSVRYWESEIVDWAAEWGLDPNLVATVMQIESCGHPDVVSSAGAMGLFQVMPFHFKAGEATFNPNTNAYRGLSYLSRSLEAHQGNIYLALAGYNAGITGSKRPESAWPNETKRYTYWGLGIFTEANNMEKSSDRLEEWLASGGASLCRRASTHLGIAP